MSDAPAETPNAPTAADRRRFAQYIADERAEAAVYRRLARLREGEEREILARPWQRAEVMLRLRVRDGFASFCFGADERDLTDLGEPFPMAPGGWTGARPGIFCIGSGGYADVRSVRFTLRR